MAGIKEERPPSQITTGYQQQQQTTIATGTDSDVTVPPNRVEFERSLNEISEEINRKQKLIEPSLLVTKDLNEQLQGSLKRTEESEEEKRTIAAEMKSIDENIKRLGANITKERDQSNRLVVGLKYKSEEMYDEQIKKLETQLHSGAHFSFNDRRKFQQAIESLSEAKLKLKDYLTMRETIDRCRTEQDELRKRKDGLHQRNKLCREKSIKGRDESDRLRKEIDKRKTAQKEKKSEQETITKELNLLYQKRKQLKDDFRQKQTDYINYMKLATPTLKVTPTQSIVEKPHKQLLAHKSLETGRKGGVREPFEEERVICQTLTNYLSRLSGASPMLRRPHTPSPTSYSPENTPNIVPRDIPRDVTASDEGYKVVQRKGEGEEEEWIPAAHRDRKDRKKIKKERRKSFSGLKTYNKPLQHNATIFEQFSKLGLHPPISLVDIPLITDQLRSLMERYESHTAESEAGDSGIMSSTGISEYSDIGTCELPSGETTPPNNHTRSPSPDINKQLINNETTPTETTPIETTPT